MSPNLGKSASGDLANPPSSLLDFSKLSTREREKKGRARTEWGKSLAMVLLLLHIPPLFPPQVPNSVLRLKSFRRRRCAVAMSVVASFQPYIRRSLSGFCLLHTALYTRQQRRLFENWSKEEGKSQKGRQPL